MESQGCSHTWVTIFVYINPTWEWHAKPFEAWCEVLWREALWVLMLQTSGWTQEDVHCPIIFPGCSDHNIWSNTLLTSYFALNYLLTCTLHMYFTYVLIWKPSTSECIGWKYFLHLHIHQHWGLPEQQVLCQTWQGKPYCQSDVHPGYWVRDPWKKNK